MPLHGKIVYETLLKSKSKEITVKQLKESISNPKIHIKKLKAKI